MISIKETFIISEASGRKNQDRVAVKVQENNFIIVLADGAGGFGNGEKIAQIVIDQVIESFSKYLLINDAECVNFLKNIDNFLIVNNEIGESTAIIIVGNESSIYGASVGDSSAWLFCNENKINLTENQQRKPLLGTGLSKPVPFSSFIDDGIILVASDGLFNYTNIENIKRVIDEYPIFNVVTELMDLVRLKDNNLHDDTAFSF